MWTEDAAPPPESLTDAPGRPRVTWGCLTAGLLGLATMAAILAGVLSLWAWHAGQERVVADELARLRAAGRPTTPAEVAALTALDPARPDATSAWVALLAEAKRSGLERDPRLATLYYPSLAAGELPATPTTADRTGLLTEYAAIGRRLDEAVAAGTNVRFAGPWTAAAAYEGPVVTMWTPRYLVLAYLNQRFLQALADGDDRTAMISVGQTLAFAEVLAREPDWWAFHAGTMAILSATLMAGELLARGNLGDAELGGLISDLGAVDLWPQLVAQLDAQRVATLASLDVPPEGRAPGVDPFFLPSATSRSGDRRKVVEHFRRFDAVLHEPDWLARRRAATDAWFDTGGDEWRTQAGVPRVPSGPEPHIVGALDSAMIVEARRRVTVAGLGMERSRRRTGAWPATVAEAVPEFPNAAIDPFDGSPLRKTTVGAARAAIAADASRPPGTVVLPGRSPDAILLYSVGPDHTDNQGHPRMPRDERGDLIQVLPPPAHATAP